MEQWEAYMLIGIELIFHLWKEDASDSLVSDLQRHTLSFDYAEVVAESVPRYTMEQPSSHLELALVSGYHFACFPPYHTCLQESCDKVREST